MRRAFDWRSSRGMVVEPLGPVESIEVFEDVFVGGIGGIRGIKVTGGTGPMYRTKII